MLSPHIYSRCSVVVIGAFIVDSNNFRSFNAASSFFWPDYLNFGEQIATKVCNLVSHASACCSLFSLHIVGSTNHLVHNLHLVILLHVLVNGFNLGTSMMHHGPVPVLLLPSRPLQPL